MLLWEKCDLLPRECEVGNRIGYKICVVCKNLFCWSLVSLCFMGTSVNSSFGISCLSTCLIHWLLSLTHLFSPSVFCYSEWTNASWSLCFILHGHGSCHWCTTHSGTLGTWWAEAEGGWCTVESWKYSGTIPPPFYHIILCAIWLCNIPVLICSSMLLLN